MTTVVLIAESDPQNLRLLQDVCEAAGHEVLTAREERGALDQVARRKPDRLAGLVQHCATCRHQVGIADRHRKR